MKYLVIDAELSGTGIRDYYEGIYFTPEELQLSSDIADKLNNWLVRYQNEHFRGYINNEQIDNLDKEGIDIALLIKNEIDDVKIIYLSDARMTKVIIE